MCYVCDSCVQTTHLFESLSYLTNLCMVEGLWHSRGILGVAVPMSAVMCGCVPCAASACLQLAHRCQWKLAVH